jgi:excisionase family DNA binding protein
MPTTITPTHQRATYTVTEVAAILGLSRANTYALLAAGSIPAIRLGTRWIIPRYRLHQWLDTTPQPVTALTVPGGAQ